MGASSGIRRCWTGAAGHCIAGVASAVLLVGVSGGALASTGDDGPVAAQDEPGAVSRQAPEWPFRGVVQYWASKATGHNVLRYWSTGTGEINEVRLGPLTWCNTYPGVSQGSVAVGSWGGPFNVGYSIPWGDEAYPVLFSAPGDSMHTGETPEPGVDKTFLEGKLDLSREQGVIHLATPSQSAHYAHDQQVPGHLVAVDEPEVEETGGSGEERDEDDMYGPGFGLIGTDGFYYALGIYWPEPACPGDEGFLVAGDTGEVVACGYTIGPALGGLAFVLPEGSPRLLEEFALPDAETSRSCEGLNVENLPVPRPVLGGDP